MARSSQSANDALAAAGYTRVNETYVSLTTAAVTSAEKESLGNSEKSDALAKLSEGFCPACDSKYRDNGRGEMVCERKVSYDYMRSRIVAMDDDDSLPT